MNSRRGTGIGEDMAEADSQLLAQYRKGNVSALEGLVQRYRRQLFGYILGMTRGQTDAEEVFQEVWFRVMRKIETYRQKNFLGWIIRIAHNIVIDQARRRKPDVSLDAATDDGHSLADTMAGDTEDPAHREIMTELGQRIAEAVVTLPEEQREVFVMRIKSDLPFKEIARIQQVSINTALARMQYALSKLRELLKEDYESLAQHA